MILTFTANPSIDSTLQLSGELTRGEVHRLQLTTIVAGGKGINVSHACTLANVDNLAFFPANPTDIIHQLMNETGIPYQTYSVSGSTRVNTSITEPDGTTTKFNGSGSALLPENQRKIEQILVALSQDCSWVVLAGSLPPGVKPTWYGHLVSLIRASNKDVNIAVDTSDKALIALGDQLSKDVRPTLLKPNSTELGQLAHIDPHLLEQKALEGDFLLAVTAARNLITAGAEMILVTLGAAGALIVTEDSSWHAVAPAPQVVSTVGAGDCTLAGFIMGRNNGEDLPTSLARGVAYGTAAVSLPGTTIPGPELINIADTIITEID